MRKPTVWLAILLMGGSGACGREQVMVTGYPLAPWHYETPKPKTPAPKPTASSRRRPPAPTTTSSTTAPPRPTPVPSAASPSATQLLQALQDEMGRLSSYDMEVESQSVKISDKKLAITHSQIRFRAPNDHRIDVKSATNSLSVGAKIVFHYGEPTAKVKMGGLLGLMTLDVPLTDYKLCTANMWPYDQIVAQGMLARLRAHPYQASILGSSTIGGAPITLIKMSIPQNPLDPNIAYEVVGVDAQHHMRLWAAYGKPELGLAHDLIYQVSVKSFGANGSVPDSLFNL